MGWGLSRNEWDIDGVELNCVRCGSVSWDFEYSEIGLADGWLSQLASEPIVETRQQ